MKMADIWVPKKVPLLQSKELHGRVRIDLHNVRSGSNERVEAHNVVTDAVDDFMLLNYLAFLRGESGARYGTVYSGLFGGVCLFEDEISGGNMLPLGANRLVGYAGTSTTVSGNRGYYNGSESSFNAISGVARTVWDWGTSQANGTIKAVARTSESAGNGSFGMANSSTRSFRLLPQDMADSNNNRYALIGVDKEDGKMFLYNSRDYGVYECGFTPTLKVSDGSISTLRYPRSLSQMRRLCTGNDTSCLARWYNPADKKIYDPHVSSGGTASVGVLGIREIDTTALSPQETWSTTTLAGSRLYNDWNSACCSGGYVYICGYNPDDVSQQGIYRVKLNDLSDVRFFNLSAQYPVHDIYYHRVYPWGVAGCCGVMQTVYNGIYRWCEFVMDKDGNFKAGWWNEPGLWSGSDSGGYLDHRYLPLAAGEGVDTWPLKWYDYAASVETYSNQTRSEIYNDFNYMATICNLGTAVTKTSSETMKLTYTLSDT